MYNLKKKLFNNVVSDLLPGSQNYGGIIKMKKKVAQTTENLRSDACSVAW
jgi:hypothetical protein